MPLKPRDIREQLRGNIDPKVGKILVQLCEDVIECKQLLVQVLTLQSKWAGVVALHDTMMEKLLHDPRLGQAAALQAEANARIKENPSVTVNSEAVTDDDNDRL